MKFEQHHQEEQPPPRRFLVQWKDCYHQTIVGPEFLKGRYGLCEQCASNPNEKGTCKVSAYHRRAHIQDVTEITSRLDKRRQHKQQQNDAKKTVLSFGDDDDNNNKDNRDNTLKAIDYFLTIINEIIRDEGSRKLTFDEAVKEFRQDFREEFPADADKFDNFIRRFIKSD